MKKNSTSTQYGNLPKNVIKSVYETISFPKSIEEVLSTLETVGEKYNHTDVYILLLIAIKTACNNIQLTMLQIARDRFIEKYDKFLWPDIKEPRLRKIYLEID